MRFALIGKTHLRLRSRIWFLTLFFAPAVHAQNVSLFLKDEPIEKAFRIIESQTLYRFIYSTETIKNAKHVSLKLNDAPLGTALTSVFAGQPLSFQIEERQIIVKRTAVAAKEEVLNINGRVTDEEGHPLQGVNVTVKGSGKGTITGPAGEFWLKEINPDATLVFSYVGRETLELPVMRRQDIEVVLKIVPVALDETIIQAYGTTTRRLSTGNITKVAGKELENAPLTNPLEGLQGRVPGLLVTQSSGLAGSSFKVQLRGRTAIDPSITDDQPLFIIDGVPYAPNNAYLGTMPSALGIPSNSSGILRPGGLSPFASINTSDIESIEILKDADATAIYGSRGANGVILITTKKGKPGKTSLNANLQYGIGRPSRLLPMMTTTEYLLMRHEAFYNDSVAAPLQGIHPDLSNAYDFLAWDTGRYTNLSRLLLGNKAHFSQAQLSLSGGNGNTQFLVDGGYRRESSIYIHQPAFTQVSAHFNVSHGSTNGRFRLQFSGSFTSDDNETYGSDLTSLLELPPNLLVYDSSGGLGWNEKGIFSGWNNPLSYANVRYRTTTDNLVSNIVLNYRLGRGLSFNCSAGYNSVFLQEQSTNPLSSQNPVQNIGRSASFSDRNFHSYLLEPHLDYRKSGDKAAMELMLGGSWQNQSVKLSSISASGYLDDSFLNSVAGAGTVTAGRGATEYKYAAVFGRATWSWKKRYLFNFSARRDGSSRFGPARQFANFGSAGAAWILSNEKWLAKKGSFLSFAKIRASAGLTGNDKISDYLYLDTWKNAPNTYQGGSALLPSKLFNPDYRWEKTIKTEAAIELGFFNDAVLFSADYYRNRSSNQLVNYKLPVSTGFSSIVQNLDAVVVNTGFEAALSASIFKKSRLQWNASLNLTLPKTKLTRFPNLSQSSYASSYVVGEPLNLIYGYRFLGIDPLTGVYVLEDRNKDGSISSADRQALGSLDPKFFGGLTNTLQYGCLQLDVLFQYTGREGPGLLGALSAVPGTIRNMPEAVLDRWRAGNAASFQQYTQGSSTAAANLAALIPQSDGAYADASYLRLKTLTLSCRLPAKTRAALKLETCSFYLTGQNLLTISSYKGGDPEVQNYLRMPTLRLVIAGIQLSL